MTPTRVRTPAEYADLRVACRENRARARAFALALARNAHVQLVPATTAFREGEEQRFSEFDSSISVSITFHSTVWPTLAKLEVPPLSR